MLSRAIWALRSRPLAALQLKLKNLWLPAKLKSLKVYVVGTTASTRYLKSPIVCFRPDQLPLQERGLSLCRHSECSPQSAEYINVVIGTSRTLLFSLYTHNYCALPSLACATTKIEELIATGQIDVVKDICRWNPSLDALPRVMYRVLPSKSNATSRKKPFLLSLH